MPSVNGPLYQVPSGDRRLAIANDKKLSVREQVLRIAHVAECGDTSVLINLPCSMRAEVLRELMRLRRKRLMQFIAGAIAQDIRRSRSVTQEAK